MRVAGQEGVGAMASTGVASEVPGTSAAGGFTALLALLQSGGLPAEITAIAGSDATIGGAPDDAANADGDVAQETGSVGDVVVTLSVASAAASTVATVASVAAGPAIAGEAAPGDGASPRNGGVATSLLGGDAVLAVRGAPGADDAAVATVAANEAVPTAKDGTGACVAADGGHTNAPSTTGAGDEVHARAADGRTSLAAGSATSVARATDAQDTNAAQTAAQPAARRTGAADGAATPAPGRDASALEAPARGAPASAFAAAQTTRNDGDEADATEDRSAPAFSRGTSDGAPPRALPEGVRVLSEPARAVANRGHDSAAGDAATRPEGLGIARADAPATSGASGGAERLRASGFTPGTAALPSWVERLASQQGLAATRRGDALHMDLEPNGLGRIEVRLSLGRDGLRASVIAEHEHTRTLLASQQPQLAAALERNDLRLESFLVDVGAQAGGDGREAWRDATDPAAFDQIGMAHAAERDAVPDEPLWPSPASRGLVSVRA